MWIIDFIRKSLPELLFPSFCAVCGKAKTPLCLPCIKSLKLAVDTTSPYTYSHFSYKDNTVRSLLKKIKYYRKPYLIKSLVQEISLSHPCSSFVKALHNPIFIPIPTPRLRVWLRGEDHTKLIAEAFGEAFSIQVTTSILFRKKYVSQQVQTHSRKERLRNIKNTFDALPCGKENLPCTLVLIDDVTTTGATLEEARNTLISAGYKDVYALTIAH